MEQSKLENLINKVERNIEAKKRIIRNMENERNQKKLEKVQKELISLESLHKQLLASQERKEARAKQLTGEEIKKKFRLGNTLVQAMKPRNLARLWYDDEENNETNNQKILRIRTEVAKNNAISKKLNNLKEYKGVYFEGMYYRDLITLSKLPRFFFGRSGTNDIKKNFNKAKGFVPYEDRGPSYVRPATVKITNTIDDSSTKRIQYLRTYLNEDVLSWVRNDRLSKIFEDLDLIKKLNTVKLMDHETSVKYKAFLEQINKYRIYTDNHLVNLSKKSVFAI